MTANLGVRINQTWLESTVYNIWNMRYDGSGVPNYAEIATELEAFFTEFEDQYSDDWAVSGLTIRDYNGGSPFTVEQPFSAPVVGTVTSANLPTQIAPVTRLTAVDVPPNRGRIYWPGCTTAMLAADGRVTTTHRNNRTAMTQILVDGFDITGGNIQLVIARVIHSQNIWSGFNNVDGILTLSAWGVQRRRRPGSGI